MERNSWQFLNPSFFVCEEDDRENIVSTHLRKLSDYKLDDDYAEVALEILGMGRSCYNHKAFLKHVCAFKSILETKPHSSLKFKEMFEKVQLLFEHGHPEEWCLLLYETYFWYCSQGTDYIHNILKEGLFQEHVNVFSKRCKKFCVMSRNIPKSLVHGQVSNLFKKLKLHRFRHRSTKEDFTNKLMPTFKKLLSKAAFMYFDYCLKNIEEAEWVGNWFIIDIDLFVCDLIAQYEKEVKVIVSDDAAQRNSVADFIFLVSVYYLVYGELTTWDSISEIPFASNAHKYDEFLKCFP